MTRLQSIYNTLEKVTCYIIVFLLTPMYFIFMMSVVRQTVVQVLQMGMLKHCCHVILSIYCFINVTGNMLLSIYVDSSIKAPAFKENSSEYCNHCQIVKPLKSWHCKKCNICILRRDHHCFVFSRCIGLYNQRYFILYLGHLAVAMIYSTIYSYYYVAAKFDENGLFLSAFRIINPFLRYLITEPWSVKELYVFFLFFNTSIIIWSLGLFLFHFKNLLKGVTAHERHKEDLKVFNSRWKSNIEDVLGSRWYLAILWPFSVSPLPIPYDILKEIK